MQDSFTKTAFLKNIKSNYKKNLYHIKIRFFIQVFLYQNFIKTPVKISIYEITVPGYKKNL